MVKIIEDKDLEERTKILDQVMERAILSFGESKVHRTTSEIHIGNNSKGITIGVYTNDKGYVNVYSPNWYSSACKLAEVFEGLFGIKDSVILRKKYNQ